MADSKKTVAILSNVTVDLVATRLRRQYNLFIPEGFDTWVQEVIDPASTFYRTEKDAVVLLLDGTEARGWKSVDEGRERLELWEQALSLLSEKVTDIPVFVSTIVIRENRIRTMAERRYRTEMENEWYQFVQGLVEEKSNLYILDIADVVTNIGEKQFYSNKMWYMSSMPYSRDGLMAVSIEITYALSTAFAARRKCIVLDLDNTLWGGVVGEDGVEGIELSDHKEGQRFYDFQRQILEMKNRGIILALNSKNNPEDAEAAIQGHPAMLLRDDAFVSRKINWENKALNQKALQEELNITEGGFIFIDDNPVEQETVHGECPEVLVPSFPTDSTELLGFAENIWKEYCRPLRLLKEDLNKTQMYQSEAKRKQELSVSLNIDDYISRLEMSVDIHRMRPDELDRVTQLCGKTNQFNLTTKRYTKAEIEEIAANPEDAVYVVYSSDKYGDSGLISVVILKGEKDALKIDTFLMSCRVMGRKLEEVILNELAGRYADHRILVGEYIPTAKNAPVKDLYDRLGFSLELTDDTHKVYKLDIAGYQKDRKDMYKSIRFDD